MNSSLRPAIMWIHIGLWNGLRSGLRHVGCRRAQGRLDARHCAGTWFFVAMLVLGVSASILEPYRSPPGSPIGGIVPVCYFVATSWVTARRRDGTTGKFEIAACAGRARPGGAQ